MAEQLKNLTRVEQLNGGDTKVALEILHKITSNESLLPKDTRERKKLGKVSSGNNYHKIRKISSGFIFFIFLNVPGILIFG